MKCPTCKDVTLQEKNIGTRNTRVLCCSACQSYWIKEAKLEDLLGAQAAADMKIPAYAMACSKSCPQCQLGLYEFCYPHTEIILAGCKRCQGVSIERKGINAIDKLMKNLLQLKCPRCDAVSAVNKLYIDYAACASCGSLFKNWFDREGRPLSVDAPSQPQLSSAAMGLGAAEQYQSEDEANSVNGFEDEWPGVSDAKLEYKFCLFAMPVMLFIGFLFNSFALGASMQRIWLTMPVHEFGHALTAWLTGYNAIPSLWVTVTFTDSRGFIAPVILLAGVLALGRYALFRNSKMGLILVGSLLLLQFIGTFILSSTTADMLIIFGGDGMGIVIATALISSFYYGKDTRLYHGALRWGFLMIGAAAFVDIYMVWFSSLGDLGQVPYGTTGGRFTDSYRLVEDHGWSFDQLINRYFYLGNLCIVILAAVYYKGLKQAKSIVVRREMEERE